MRVCKPCGVHAHRGRADSHVSHIADSNIPPTRQYQNYNQLDHIFGTMHDAPISSQCAQNLPRNVISRFVVTALLVPCPTARDALQGGDYRASGRNVRRLSNLYQNKVLQRAGEACHECIFFSVFFCRHAGACGTLSQTSSVAAECPLKLNGCSTTFVVKGIHFLGRSDEKLRVLLRTAYKYTDRARSCFPLLCATHVGQRMEPYVVLGVGGGGGSGG